MTVQLTTEQVWQEIEKIEYIPHSVGKARQGLPNPGHFAGFDNPARAKPRQVGHTRIK